MLFAVNRVPRGDVTAERDKRTLKLFTNWKPPAGLDFKGFYDLTLTTDASATLHPIFCNSQADRSETSLP